MTPLIITALVLTVSPAPSVDRPAIELRHGSRKLLLYQGNTQLETGWAWGRLPDIVGDVPRAKALALRATSLDRAAWIVGIGGFAALVSGAITADAHQGPLGFSLVGGGGLALLSSVFLASWGDDAVRAAVAAFNEGRAAAPR